MNKSNRLQANVPFLYLLENIQKSEVFWRFQGLQKESTDLQSIIQIYSPLMNSVTITYIQYRKRQTKPPLHKTKTNQSKETSL